MVARALFRLASVTVALALAGSSYATNDDDETGQATLPLEELLKLHADATAAGEDDVVVPPMDYSVHAIDIGARIVGNAVEGMARVRLTVFSNDWVSVPLFPRQPGWQVTSLPAVSGGSVTSDDGDIRFLANKRGTYDFQIGFLKRARRAGSAWQLDIRTDEAVIQRLRLAHDRGLFRLDERAGRRDGDSVEFFASDGRFTLNWRALRTQPTEAPADDARVVVDPVVESGAVTVVVTLDGQRISRYLYELRFQGAETIEVTVPEGQTLNKVFLNGVSQTFELEDGVSRIEVRPSRPGDQKAVLELVSIEQNEPLALAGRLRFFLPTLSWGVNELYASLHLPNVFNYTWVGGSLAPGDARVGTRYTFDVPTPGKLVSLHQQLVLGSADVQVDYAVDLTDKYYR